MKLSTIIYSGGALFALSSTSFADFTLDAPGMSSATTKDGSNVQIVEDMGKYWRYQITGYEWRIVSGKYMHGGKISAGGDLTDANGTPMTGSSAMNASIIDGGDWQINTATLSSTNIADVAFDSVTYATPKVYKNQYIRPRVNLVTDMERADGSYLSIRGVAMKKQPRPEGDLIVNEIVREGSTPNIQWTIKRIGEAGTQPGIPNSVANWSFDIQPGDTPATPPADDPSEDEATDAPNKGKNKTQEKSNNGHGNNVDGIDVSNPGNSAAKWADKWGITDTDYDGDGVIEDDEGKGGGAAPSKR